MSAYRMSLCLAYHAYTNPVFHSGAGPIASAYELCVIMLNASLCTALRAVPKGLCIAYGR
jgi:hypothetical protein